MSKSEVAINSFCILVTFVVGCASPEYTRCPSCIGPPEVLYLAPVRIADIDVGLTPNSLASSSDCLLLVRIYTISSSVNLAVGLFGPSCFALLSAFAQ